MLRRFTLSIGLVVALSSSALRANVPQQFTVQGVLRDKGGSLQSLMATVTVKLFAAAQPAAGEQPLTQVPLTGIEVANGLFTVQVPVTPELSAALAQPQVWLEMTVNGDTFPRQQLTPDVYALLCGTADGLSSVAIVDGAQLRPASVTAAALGPSITTPAWQPVTFDDGKWSNYGPGYNAASYYLDPFGVVHLRGLVLANGTAAGTRMFTLPVGMRPAKQWIVPAVVSETVGSVTQTGIARIDIHSDGAVQINVYSKNPMSWVSLDGITFTIN